MTPVEAYDHLRRLSQTQRLLRLSFPHDDDNNNDKENT
jgi:hypothetical protein